MQNITTNTEKDLLLLASKGCKESFTKIFLSYNDRLYSFILRLTKSEEQTLDIIQDIFMKLWINRDSLATIENIGSYIFRSAQNTVINSFKRVMIEASMLAKLQGVETSDNNIADNFEYKILESKLKNVVEKLPGQQRLVYTLSREQGLKHDDIAQQLHISSATVKNHMVQALRTIKKFLREDYNIAEIFLVVLCLGIIRLCY